MKNRVTGILLCVVLVMIAALCTTAHVRATEVIDDTGSAVHIDRVPRRIVSLAPSITETLFALDLEERIAGVSQFSNYPDAAQKKPKVGSYINISIERVVALDPDLIIGTSNGNKAELLAHLRQLGFTVFVTNPLSIKGVFDTVMDIGEITGCPDRAERLVTSLRERVRAVTSRVAGLPVPRVFYQIGIDPIVSSGPDTFHDILITLAGGRNIAAVSSVCYPRYSIEEIVAEHPDIIILSSMKRGEDFETVRLKWQKWRDVPAVKHGRIHIIDSDVTDHPSPRIIDGLERMAEIIHPTIQGAGCGRGR